MADTAGRRVGERPLLVAEQLAFDQGFGKGGAIQGNEGTVPPGAVVVERLGHQFLAGSAFAGDQHRGAAVGHLFDLSVDLLHRPALSDEVMKGVALGDLGAELFDFAFEFLGVECAVDDDAEFFDVEGFRQVVRRAQLHGIHRGLDGLCTRQHDDRGGILFRPQGLQHRQPVGAGENDVQQHEMGGFFVEQVQPFLRIGGLDDLIRGFKHGFQRGPDSGFVVH